MPDVLTLLNVVAERLILACWEPRQSEARALWVEVLGADWLSPSDRLAMFRARLIAGGIGGSKLLGRVDIALPGGRRPRRYVRDRGPGPSGIRAEFADVQEA
jgi:hypothetical protein